MHFLRPLLGFSRLDSQRNSDIRERLKLQYSLRDTRMPTSAEIIWKDLKETALQQLAFHYWGGTMRLWTTKMMMERETKTMLGFIGADLNGLTVQSSWWWRISCILVYSVMVCLVHRLLCCSCRGYLSSSELWEWCKFRLGRKWGQK